MAIAISNSPTIGSFLYSDQPLTLSITGSGFSSPYNKPTWESQYGSFNDYLTASPVFEAYDKTLSNVSVVAREMARMYNSGENNWTTTGTNMALSNTNSGTYIKNSGSNGVWDSVIFSTISSADLNWVLDFRAVENTKSKAVGVASASTTVDPTSGSSSFYAAWHLRSDGTAMPYKAAGVALLTSGVAYSAGTRFAIRKVGTTVSFYLDNALVISFVIGAGLTYKPLLGLQDTGASVESIMFQAQDGSSYVATLAFDVIAVFPEQPNWGYELDKDNKTLSSVAEDGSAIFRLKGPIKRSLSLQFPERPFTEFSVISDFWDFHQKHIKFYYRDIVFDTLSLVVFDSGLKLQPVGADRISISVVIREV